jgi:hypothetical protein
MKQSFANYPNCHSSSRFDEFTARLLSFKKEGTYVDIGSQHSMLHNNSYFLSTQLDWRGICIDQDPGWDDSYKERKHCTYINKDATKLDYKQTFIDYNMPNSIDCLSLDVDVLDFVVAQMLPHNDFKFKIIGIEHDYYQHGDKYRAPQRELLIGLGYVLACADIYVRHPDLENCSYEDWYLDPNYFSQDIINNIKVSGSYPEDIIVKLGGKGYWVG